MAARASTSDADTETMEKATMDLAGELKTEFAARDQLYRDIDAVLFGNLPVQIPEAYRTLIRSFEGQDLAS